MCLFPLAFVARIVSGKFLGVHCSLHHDEFLYSSPLDLVGKCPKMADKPGKFFSETRPSIDAEAGDFAENKKTTYTSKKANKTIWIANRYYEHKE